MTKERDEAICVCAVVCWSTEQGMIEVNCLVVVLMTGVDLQLFKLNAWNALLMLHCCGKLGFASCRWMREVVVAFFMLLVADVGSTRQLLRTKLAMSAVASLLLLYL